MKKTQRSISTVSLWPARFIFFAGELEGVKTSIEAQIGQAELMKDIDDILTNLDAPFDAKIKEVIAGIEAANAAEKDTKKHRDVDAARAELNTAKESLKTSLKTTAELAKKNIKARAEKAADDLTRDLAKPSHSVEQVKRREADPGTDGGKIFDDAGFKPLNFTDTGDIEDREGTTEEYWTSNDLYAAAKEIITAIYIEQGKEAAEAKAAELQESRGKNGRIDEENFPGVFKHHTTPINFESENNDLRIIDDATDSRLTGRIYGFFYTSGSAFERKDGTTDTVLLNGYRTYLNTMGKEGYNHAEGSARDTFINSIKSPTEWAQENYPELLAKIKGEPEKTELPELDEKNPPTKESYTSAIVASISDLALRDRVQNILIGVLGSSKNVQDWPLLVTGTLSKMGLKPENISSASNESITKLGLDGKYGSLDKEKTDIWIRDYIDGLVLGAREFYKGKKLAGTEEEFVASYRKHLEEKFLGSNSAVAGLAIGLGETPDDPNKNRDRRMKVWDTMRALVDTPAEFWAASNKEPEKPKGPERKEGDIYQEGEAWKKWEGGKPVDVVKGQVKEDGLYFDGKEWKSPEKGNVNADGWYFDGKEWRLPKTGDRSADGFIFNGKEWKEIKAGPARVAGGGTGRGPGAGPSGVPGGTAPEMAGDKTPAQRWEDFSRRATVLAPRIAEAVAQNANDPLKIPDAVRKAAGSYFPQMQSRYAGDFLLPSGVGITIGGPEGVKVAGYAPDAAKKPTDAPQLDARWTAAPPAADKKGKKSDAPA